MWVFQAKIIFSDLFVFHKAELFRMVLIMTWAIGKQCLEINVILYSGYLYTLYSGYLSVVCTFYWNHETNGLNHAVKIL